MKYIYPVLLVLTIVACSHKSAQKVRHKSSILWKISGNGLKSPSYLLGTFHVLGKQFADSLGIEREIKECRAVAGEIIIDSLTPQKSLAAARLKSGSLKTLFTPDEYDSIATVFKNLSRISLDQLDQYKPAAVEAALIIILAPKASPPALDNYIQKRGKELGEQIIGLETVDEQIDILFNVPMEAQKQRLLSSVREIDLAKKNIYKTYNLYLNQDIEGMYSLTKADHEFSAGEWDKILKNRNLKWMNKVPEIINAQPTFIAVGAGHLGGPYGLIKQLQLKGYAVTPIAI